MTPERSRRCFALLREALDLHGAARESFVAALDAEDAELGRELRRLLDHSAGPALLDRAAGDIAADLIEGEVELVAGAMLGGWRVLGLLGRGGMGAVYRVTRSGDGYAQGGALKLIKRGMDSGEILRRFRRERRLLARLEHPNIARLLDGGGSSAGQPWFVMEYVEGVALLQYAQSAQLDLRRRIALFLKLCDAVAHAHSRLVVHRDINPGNVLCTAAGEPKLLDFGIARLLEDDTGRDVTATAAPFFTRAYAAPEQLRGEAATTATDVHALGLLLWELLSGERRSTDAVTGRATDRLARARMRAGGDGPATVTPAQLRGDLGVILARATDPEPARRYATAQALGEDVRRHLDGEPILARADSSAYRLRVFVRRHRWIAAAIAAAVVALLVGSGLALWQAHRAGVQERRAGEQAASAEAVKQFMIGLFEAPDPSVAQGSAPRADELLDRGAARIAAELAGQPRVQADLYEAMARSYMGLGRFDRAAELLERGLAAIDGDAAALDTRVRLSLELGAGNAELGRYGAALEVLEKLPVPTPAVAARIETLRGWVLRDQGRYADSEAALRRALAALGNDGTRIDEASAGAINNLAYTLQLAGRGAESVALFQRVADFRAATLPAGHPARLWANYTFGKSLRSLGQPRRALDLLEPVRAPMLGVVGGQHSDLAGLDIAIGQSRMDLGETEAGHALVVDAVARSHRAAPMHNALWTEAETALAEAEFRVGNDAAATEHFQAARAAWLALVGAEVPQVRDIDGYLAALRARRDRGAVAAALAELQALAVLRRERGEMGLAATLDRVAEVARLASAADVAQGAEAQTREVRAAWWRETH